MMIHLLLLLAFAERVASLALNLCSSTNLGAAETSNQFMSNGYCRDYCSKAGYTVAITQNYNCWCSTAVPENTVDSDLCDTACPGYSEQEKCGGDGVYGYVVFGAALTLSGLSSLLALATSANSESSDLRSVSTLSSESTSSTISLSSQTATALLTTTAASTTTMSGSSKASQTTESLSASSALSSTLQKSLAPPTLSLHETPQLSVSMFANTVLSVITINGSVLHQVSTKYVTASATLQPTPTLMLTQLPSARQKNAFFDSSAKVAGTFTAVGVVVVALIVALAYCCCFAGGAHRDEYSDEEQQYSSDENSMVKLPAVPPDFGAKLRSSSHLNLRRNSSNKSIMLLFNIGTSSPEIGRSQSRKKLNPTNEGVDPVGPIMPPITEFDHALDPRAMFAEYNHSKLSLSDENDYSRRIWHVTNP